MQEYQAHADIDVVIPVYNGADFLAPAIASVLAQSLLPRRIIVVDDGSTDDSAEVAGSFVGGPVEVVVVRKPNGGLSSARNAGLALCRAELVALLDADDLWLPHKLERQVDCLRTSDLPDVGVIYCDYDDIDEEGRPLPDFPSRRLSKGLRGRIKQRLIAGNLVAGSGSAVLIRRRILEQVGGFDESLPCSEDWDMWLRLADRCAFDYVDDVLVRLRRHPASMQATVNDRLLRTDLRVLARQRGDARMRALSAAASVKRLAVAPPTAVSDLLDSMELTDRALVASATLNMPRPLLRSLVYGASAARGVYRSYKMGRARRSTPDGPS